MKNPAQGSRRRGRTGKLGRRLRCCVAFDSDQFEEIREQAVEDRTSFAEQVRLLVEWGLESARLASQGSAPPRRERDR